jgi:hypothetical protein
MQDKAKAFFVTILMLSLFSLALVSMAAAAGSITLTPATQAAGGTVSVAGTSFGVTKPVAIGVGTEVAGSDANMAYTGTGTGPYSGKLSHYPVKPGSFVLTSDTSSGAGIVSTYTDAGDGTTIWSYDGTPMGTINYVTGAWSRSTTVDVTDIAANYSATYIYYQYNATPAGGVTTSASGAFTASITVPAALTNGNYNVTAVDTSGNRATATLTVSGAIPEVLPVGLILVLASVAMIVGMRFSSKLGKSRKPL